MSDQQRSRRMRIIGPYVINQRELFTLVLEWFNPDNPEKVSRDERYTMERSELTALYESIGTSLNQQPIYVYPD